MRDEESVSERLYRLKRRGVAPFLLDKIKDELKFHLFSSRRSINEVFDRWVPMPLYARRLQSKLFLLWYILDALYPRSLAKWRKHVDSHPNAGSLKHQIEEIAKELLDKGEWAKAKSILKPLIEWE